MNEETSKQAIGLRENALGICAMVFSILSLFFNTILFAPAAIILAVIAFIKRQYTFAVSALIICVIAIASSTVLKIFSFIAF